MTVDLFAGRLPNATEAVWELANGVRKVIYRDPDGNEIGVGGAPLQ